MPDIKRQTAYKCTISQIINGKYVIQQGWEPNYIDFGDLKVSRVNVVAAIVTKESNVLTVEDGTSSIELRIFSDPEKASKFNVGDIILIVGRPREYNEKRYIVPEILRKIEDTKWVQYRKKELELEVHEEKQPVKEEKQEIQPTPMEEQPRPNNSYKIIEAIKKLDSGDGADTQSVIKECDVKDAEEQIETLLNEGEIFEIRAGKLKILE